MKKNKKILNIIILIPRHLEIFLIKVYQKFISNQFGRKCKYYPSCSNYTMQAVDKYGIIKGNILGIIRILKCNPFSHGGVDKLK